MRLRLALALSPAAWLSVTLLLVLIALMGVMGWRLWLRSRVPPEEIERRRRQRLSAIGKLGDATLIEVHDTYVVYTYDVRGVAYTASQDISHLKNLVPPEAGLATTPVLVKYDVRNPADSILLAENWNGLTVLKRF